MIDVITLILELIGTVAFAVSGAFVGIEKKMDILGISILGVTTAVGGGVIRDMILGLTPPQAFRHPLYLCVALVTSLVVFIPGLRALLEKNKASFDLVLLIMDSLGLGVFTVLGLQVAKQHHTGVFLAVFVGILTGVGGGVLRDMMSGNTPYIFRKHFYCSASILGALTAAALWTPLGEVIAMIAGACVIFVLRLLAAHYRWKLPRA